MAFEFKLPDIGEGLHEGTLVEWLVAIGDQLTLDQPFARVETDKAVVDLPAPRAAVVHALHFEPGDVIEVGQVMITFADAGGDSAASGQGDVEARSTAPVPPAANGSNGGSGTRATRPDPADPHSFRATPRTRALARRLGVDLSLIPPSGKAGRITDDDVTNAAGLHDGAAKTNRLRREPTDQIRRRQPTEAVATTGMTEGIAGEQPPRRRRTPTQVLATAGRGEQAPALPAVAARSTADSDDEQRVPLTHLRKVIADAMSLSKRTAAHVTHVDEADVTDLLAAREQARSRLDSQAPRLTLLPYFVRAVTAALANHPRLNATYDAERQELVIKRHHHIGFAVDTDEGLVVPVLRHADRKDLLSIATEVEDLATRARARRLTLDELRGSTFTISSLGPLGGAFATPIINQPELAIIGLHAIKERPAVVDGQVVPRKMMYVSLSYDHRFIDGAVAARFMVELIDLIQHPSLLMLRL